MRRLAHYVRRFFSVWAADPLLPSEQAGVGQLLSRPEAALFWDQPPADQRHGWEGVERLRTAGLDRPDLERAALLHDVGKAPARLGVIGRSLASGLSLFRLPVTSRMRRYLDHGDVGAALLEEAKSDPLTVDFARHHHGERPTEIVESDWAALLAADAETKPKARQSSDLR